MVGNTFDDLWNQRLADAMLANWTGNVATDYEATTGFLQNMINRIGRTVVTGADSINNPFARWTDQVMDYGDTIQKYTLGYLTGYQFDPEADDPYTKVKNPPIAQYAKFNESMQYQNTIDNTRLQFAFTNAQTFGDFVGAMVSSIYESSGLDKFLKWKKYLTEADYVPTGNKIVADYDAQDSDVYAMSVLDKIKDIAKMCQFPNDKNKAGRLGAGVNFDVVMTYKTKNEIDKALSGVYNLEKLEVPNVNWIFIDEFATKPSAEGETDQLDIVMVDSRMMHYTPRTPESGAIYNPKGRYTNYFYTEEGIYSFDLFRDAFHIFKPTA